MKTLVSVYVRRGTAKPKQTYHPTIKTAPRGAQEGKDNE
jgi:hypothetical protein